MSHDLIHRIYASTATQPFDEAQLAQLLHLARRRNAQLGLTGMLLYAEGSFFQVLEGSPEAVDGLYERIERDPRHGDVVCIVREPITHRSFDAWTMGFVNASARDLSGLVGTGALLGGVGAGRARIDAGRARRLLDAFCRGAWRKRLEGAQQAASA